jgi:hypothetical protein
VRIVLVVLLLANCADDSGSSGPGITTHVVTFEFPAAMGATCLDAELADVDATTPGDQYDCSVSQIIVATQMEAVLPQCNNLTSPSSSTNRPCWAIESDSASCPSGAQRKLAIERAEPPPDATIKAQCVAVGA